MNREDIIKLAREAGFVAYGEDAGEYRIPTPAFHCRLERFAALVAAASAASEREACAKVCEGVDFKDVQDAVEYAHVFAAAIRARGGAT